jgi:hypothetical protein
LVRENWREKGFFYFARGRGCCGPCRRGAGVEEPSLAVSPTPEQGAGVSCGQWIPHWYESALSDNFLHLWNLLKGAWWLIIARARSG